MTFIREQRYVVLKHTDIDFALDLDKSRQLGKICDQVEYGRAMNGKIPLTCVVVESDWPEYEVVWKMIQDRMEKGKPRCQACLVEKEPGA